MTNSLETLIKLNENMIMNSKYQNTTYKDKTMWAFLGRKPTTTKKEESFHELILKMIDKLPAISYENVIKYRPIYEKYPHLYLRFVGQHNYLVQVKTFLDHIDKYNKKDEIPVSFYLPSFFSRSYKIIILNKKTGMTHEEKYEVNSENKRPETARKLFLYLVYFDKTYEEILENTDWEEYESLISELKSAN